jgi:endo-1,4-beta-xylanase
MIKMKIFRVLFIGILVPLLVIMVSCGDPEEDQVNMVLKAPSMGTPIVVSQESIKFSWVRISGATHYLIDVSESKNFTEMVSPYANLKENGTSLIVVGLSPSTTYYARVRAVKTDVNSGYSDVASARTKDSELQEPDTALKEAATTFSVGVAVQSTRFTGQYDVIINREFDQITAEWEMKMNPIYNSQSAYDFSRADKIVDYAVKNGIQVHGHSLIWHNATPSWVENFSGTNAEFEKLVKDYITATVTRYKGKVRSWDVVNEAFEDGTGKLRNSVFRQKMGDDYIAKCYKWTREADPDVLIFYNDYNMTTDNTKLNAILAMADDFKTRGIPLNGIGFQMHISYDGPSKSAIESAAKKVTDRNLLLHFSELDIRANPTKTLTSLTVDRAIAQQNKVKEVVQIYNAIPAASKFAITVWGVKDNDSWLIDFWKAADWPLLWDANFKVKKAHTGFLQGLE